MSEHVLDGRLGGFIRCVHYQANNSSKIVLEIEGPPTYYW